MIDGAVKKKLQQAEELLGRQEFAKAISVLGEIDLRSISPEQKAFHSLIYAHANLRLGHNQVRDELEFALTHYHNVHDDEKYALGKLLYGLMLLGRGEFIDAKEALLEAYVTYKRCDDYQGQAWALSRLASVAHHTGDFESSITNLEKCIELYTLNHDSERRWPAAMNLAQVLRACGKLRSSFKLFADEERSLFQRDRKGICQYYLMRSVPCALLGDLDSARQLLGKARPYLDEFVREKAIYREYLGKIHNLEGDYEEALKILRQGLDISIEIAPESSLISQTKRLMADACFGLGQFKDSRKLAGEALATAKKLNERVEIAGCHRVYAQIEASGGDADTAREWFGKALDIYSAIGSRYELALTRYLAATTGIYLNGERQALLYLALEYFRSESVDYIVEKIDRELTGPPRMRTHPRRPAVSAPTIIRRSVSMKRLVELAEHIAPSGMSVLLTGPTGTGKDLLARYIHHFSGRMGRFISVNAAAIPKDMIESELFGYRRGAYTGAAMTTSGWIEESEGGTFYLNEIADASPELQAKLLDVIENRRICRLGERQEREIDCRFIAATNHRLEKLIEEGQFRLDLFHRLNEIPIHLPPLSERREDIRLLLEHFLNMAGVKIATKADRTAVTALTRIFHVRPWQGNVRELETEVKRLALVCRGDIPRMVKAAAEYQLSTKEETLAALQRAGWNRREVGRMLGISESTVRHRIKVYNLTEDK
jgi:DNA-binding NtrC family response regulator/tetratricopeptide (TPR) repeat protein